MFSNCRLPGPDDELGQLYDEEKETWMSLDDVVAWHSYGVQSSAALSVITSDQVLQTLATSDAQLIDCRPLVDYLGLTPDAKISGHIDGSISVPASNLLDDDASAFLPQEQLIDYLELAGVDFMADAVVLGGTATDAAIVATGLLLAGHSAVSLCIGSLDEAFVSQLPESLKTSIYDPSELLFQTDEGSFDLSPNAPIVSDNEIEAGKEIEREYEEELRQPHDSTYDDDENADAANPLDEIVWVSSEGHRYFDMPRPIDKPLFLATSEDIFRVVSFVLAPFGFPSDVSERLTLADVKTRTSSLFQDVIEVCSDLVYHERGLNEGVMAMSVHKWVEQKRDKECSNQVRAINELVDSLYERPTFVVIPDMSEERVVELADRLFTSLTAALKKKSPWAFEDEIPIET
ncbi:hypothetical protein PINS_up003502 [Pythium insidiosum]|nr:hypothetical protein PINS_up003502 [Pythium insidiosum]